MTQPYTCRGLHPFTCHKTHLSDCTTVPKAECPAGPAPKSQLPPQLPSALLGGLPLWSGTATASADWGSSGMLQAPADTPQADEEVLCPGEARVQRSSSP
eukprot:CAMPEP_0202919302 /NCGR_PEP_ID=MMETSP1392-20130828/75499_1 /ASSEMBLY_ACC=CAM_ASM_000868 /TAXON_ID=225041 /ORGANISM="Chlamydomonas chlamydogama, Strain SAG 11-48b" /LENGTH=99 /DNA_ID=CAMNT_0049612621 /DNA_START=554 /DNA_END=850 /DNA_ORIENTATION=+